jgi:universal stress protein E
MKRFNNILYMVEQPSVDDGSALARAAALAENNQARLHLLSVAEVPRRAPIASGLDPTEIETRRRDQELERMQALLAPHEKRIQATTEVRFGKDFIEVVRDVLRNRRDLVIKVGSSAGLVDTILGGTDRHLLRKCPCPVWIMQPRERANYQRVLAAVDCDPWAEPPGDDRLNDLILELASSVALSDFAELHIAHAWEPVSDGMIRVFGSDLSDAQIEAHHKREERAHQTALASLGDRLRGQIGSEAYSYLMPQLHLREGKARAIIPDLAAELAADLLVMGTVSRTGIAGLIIGNTAEMILSRTTCSVLAVKPEGFVSPVTLD